MELRRLRYFVVLAEELHFGRAAERLCLSQSALSQQLKVLEREVGVRLLERGQWGVSVTVPGQIMLEEALTLLRQSDDALARVRASANGSAGRLRVSYTRSAPTVTHAIVREFRAAFKDIEVSVETAWTTRNVEMLRAGDADVAFVLLPLVGAEDLETVRLVSSPMAAVLPIDHDLVSRDRLDRDDLLGLPIVEWPRTQAPGAYDAVRLQFWRGAAPHVVLEEPDAEHILRAVADGAGVALLDEGRASRLGPTGVSIRPLVDPPIVEHGLAWPKAGRSRVVDRFVALGRTVSGTAAHARRSR